MQLRKFDLNIEKILGDWEVQHAIREVIANAIDEQILTSTKEVNIYEGSTKKWHIRDFGRGIRYEHLTQKENDEKLKHPHVIGKFGIGLKDALATFDRHGINIVIRSKYGDITLGKSTKYGFDDIVTLHAYVSPPTNPNMVGTEFILDGVTDDDIDKAKDLFWIFSGERVVEKTAYGTVLERKGDVARIYINGVRVAEEENFLFSYNITSLTQQIRRALNRERTNVGRSAYSSRVKSILLACKRQEVAQSLVYDLKNYSTGVMSDELKWLDVQEHAVRILNAAEQVLFLTAQELMTEPDMVEETRTAGYKIVTIPDNLKERVCGKDDISGNPIRDLGQFYQEYQESFEFNFVDPRDLSAAERRIFNLTDNILRLIGGRPRNVKDVKISETLRHEIGSLFETTGVWQASTGTIIIKRKQLSSVEAYAGTLLHETAHAISGASDNSRDFERVLTSLLGRIASRIL